MPVIGITGGIASGKSSLTSRLSQRLRAEVFDADAAARELVENDPEVRLLIKEQFGPSAFSGEGVLDRQWLRELVFNNDAHRRALEEILHPAIRARWLARAKAVREAGGTKSGRAEIAGIEARGTKAASAKDAVAEARGAETSEAEARKTKTPGAEVAGMEAARAVDSGAKDGKAEAREGNASVAEALRTERPEAKAAWLLLDIPLLYEVGGEAECDAVVVVACREETQIMRIVARRGLSPEMARKMVRSQTSLASKAARADYVIWNDAPLARLDEQAELFAGYLKLWMNHLPR